MRAELSSILFWQPWSVPKEGNTIEQNEDACRVEIMGSADGAESLLVVVADGASEAVYSRLWAHALVKAAEPSWVILADHHLNERLTEVRQSFSPIARDEQIPWYIKNKFQDQGSQATLLVATVSPSEEAGVFTVRGVAVGDCCLLLFRETGEVNSFPVRSTADFGLNPMLVMNRNQAPLRFPRFEALMRHGDFLLVATDAAGKWAIECLESNQSNLLLEALLGFIAFDLQEPALGASAITEPGVNSQPHSDATHALSHQPVQDDTNEDSFFENIWSRLFGTENSSVKAEAHNFGDNQKSAYPPLDFEQFVQRQRAPESRPRMRNDDATLVFCVPVQNSAAGQASEALAIIGKHKGAAELRPLAITGE